MKKEYRFILKAIKDGNTTGRTISYAARHAGLNKCSCLGEWADPRLRKLRASRLVMHTGEKDRVGSKIHALTEAGEKALETQP